MPPSENPYMPIRLLPGQVVIGDPDGLLALTAQLEAVKKENV